MRHVRESPASGSEAKGAKVTSWSAAASEAEMFGMAAGMTGGSLTLMTETEVDQRD